MTNQVPSSIADKLKVHKRPGRYNKVTIACDQCGEVLHRVPSRLCAQNFCDRKCRGRWQSAHRHGANATNPTGIGFTEYRAARKAAKEGAA